MGDYEANPAQKPPPTAGYVQRNALIFFHVARARARRERGVDDVRTKALKVALETIWKKIDPSSPLFKRFPFDPDQPVTPLPKREPHGRFISIPGV